MNKKSLFKLKYSDIVEVVLHELTKNDALRLIRPGCLRYYYWIACVAYILFHGRVGRPHDRMT